MTLRTILFCLLCCLRAFAFADLWAGQSAFHKGDYATALREFLLLAKQGNSAAQFDLGLMYANGRGVPQGDKEAVKRYRLAADQGDSAAQFNLGAKYALGDGVPQDYKEAVKWYRLAADQGNAAAQLHLGFMYTDGRPTPSQRVEADKPRREPKFSLTTGIAKNLPGELQHPCAMRKSIGETSQKGNQNHHEKIRCCLTAYKCRRGNGMMTDTIPAT